MDLQFAYHLSKLFLLFEAFESFALIIHHRYHTFSFCARNFLVLLYHISSLFVFLYFPSQLVQFFYFDGVVNSYRLYQLLFDLILVKMLCLLAVLRVSPQLNIKNNRYTKNLKHSLQTKMRLRWAQNTPFSIRLRDVKVLRQRHFRKTVFQIKLMSKKVLKKLLLN